LAIDLPPCPDRARDADETGIVRSAGKDGQGHGYGSGRQSGPLFRDRRGAHCQLALTAAPRPIRMFAEGQHAAMNGGGPTIQDGRNTNVSYNKSCKRLRGKVIELNRVAALYEQGRIHHCRARSPTLEDQQGCAFTTDFDR